MLSRFWSIFAARNKEFYRDRAGFGWNMVFPFLIIAGFAVMFGRGGVSPYRVAVVGSLTDLARAVQEEIQLSLVSVPELTQATEKLLANRYDLVVQPGEGGPARYWINESSPKGVQAQALFILRAAGADAFSKVAEKSTVSGRAVHYIDWLFPGILAMNTMFSALYGVGFVVVRYRKNGVLKRLAATPLSAFEYLSAQVASRLVVLLFSGGTVYAFSAWLFGFRCQGSLLDLALFYTLGCTAMVSIGMVIASRSASEEFANGMASVILWPMMFLSEVWFSLEGAPAWVQTFSQALPLTHMNAGLRAIMNQGAGLSDLAVPMAALAGFSAVLMAVGSKMFKWS
ncbi:MAG: ABC transporter permease [Proteobacteria bacterium]|nr:ABC transporter permease [Pseudomonadota bacterium]